MNIKGWVVLLLMFSVSDSDPNKVVRSQTKWKADDEGRKLRKVEYKEFNSKDDLLRSIEYTERRELCSKFRYEYNSNSILIRTLRSGCPHEFASGMKTTYEYDSTGRLTKSREYEKDKLTRRTVYQYQEKQKYPYLKQEFIRKDSLPYSETELQYDSEGNVKEEIQTVSGSWFGSRRYQYDATGNLVYIEAEVDGGVGVVKYYYLYENKELRRDSVLFPDAETQYHVYENQKFK